MNAAYRVRQERVREVAKEKAEREARHTAMTAAQKKEAIALAKSIVIAEADTMERIHAMQIDKAFNADGVSYLCVYVYSTYYSTLANGRRKSGLYVFININDMSDWCVGTGKGFQRHTDAIKAFIHFGVNDERYINRGKMKVIDDRTQNFDMAAV